MEDALLTGRSTTPTIGTRSPAAAAAALGFVVDRAPVDWFVERLPIPGGRGDPGRCPGSR